MGANDVPAIPGDSHGEARGLLEAGARACTPPANATTTDLVNAALARFEARIGPYAPISPAYLADALRRGNLGMAGTIQLTPAEQADILHAIQNLLLDMPLGAYATNAVGFLRTPLENHGKSFETTRLRDVPEALGGDWAKETVETWRKNHPEIFYAVAAIAGGTLATTEGSAGLSRLGLDRFRTLRFANPHTQLMLRAHWEKGFASPGVEAVGVGEWQTRLGVLTGSLSVRTGGPGLSLLEPSQATAGVSLRNGNRTIGLWHSISRNPTASALDSIGAETPVGTGPLALPQAGGYQASTGASYTEMSADGRFGVSVQVGYDNTQRVSVGAGLMWRF